MSLPPGFLDELRTRSSLSQVVGRKVMWDTRKSNQGKGDMWAPCPFHQEKSASFHVDDRKGYYYCFGCHAKGDAITFIRETENVDFMEAVKILAAESGMPVPASDPAAQAKADKRTQLIEIMEMAVQFFRLSLNTSGGAAALGYLEKRGLKSATRDKFDIGFAPEGWQNLWDHLTGKGVAPDDIFAAGLAKPSTKGGKPYDTFRNRIMFPIRDPRGRCIAFGGRAMDPDDNAKYLNSPETILFDKGRSLYNYGPAREAAGKGHDLIVVEGYMDVIAMVEAGFEGAVAPLGTAITENQLMMMWRMFPEPIIALDGDVAGQRAAQRLIDLALPMLAESNSLFFIEMPDGQDPDDFLKSKGNQALSALIQQEKTPLVKALWAREYGAGPTDTPEQKAGLDKRVRAAISKIPDADIKRYYGEALKEFRWAEFRPNNWAPEFKKKQKGNDRATPSARDSLLARGGDANNLLSVHADQMHVVRERLVAAIALHNPQTAFAFRDGLERFDVGDNDARDVLNLIVSWDEERAPQDAIEILQDALGSHVVETILNDRFVKIHPLIRKRYEDDIVLHELAENIARVTADRAARRELAEAEEEIYGVGTEALTWRLGQLVAARDDAVKGDTEDTAEYDLGDNGARINRDERDAFAALLVEIRGQNPTEN